MDTVFGIFAMYLPNETLYSVGYYCLIAGVCGGWLAALSGLLDLFMRILKHGAKATTTAFTHAGTQAFVTTGFTILLSIEYKNQQFINSLPVWLWASKIFLVALMLLGNYLGGELLLKYVAKDFQSDNTTR